MISIPLTLPSWDNRELEAINEVLNSGNFSMGKKVEKFEQEFADYSKTKFAVMFNSGSSANLALIQALRYSEIIQFELGSEIIVPAVSWSTTFYPVNQAGFKLNFVDIDRNSLNIKIENVEKAINAKTKAIFAVNLLGNPCDLEKLSEIAKRNKIVLIEDNCESLGAEINGKKTGTFGIAGTYSFFYSHHICTMEGGMVTTDSEKLYEFLKSIRAHGWTRGLPEKNHVHPLTGNDWDDQFRFVVPGFNLRPLEIQAAAGSIQMQKFPKFLNARRENARVFKEIFKNKTSVFIQEEIGLSSWFGFALVLRESFAGKRNEIIGILNSRGVESRPIVAGNFLRNPVIKHLDYSISGELTNADYIHENGLFVGNHHINFENKIMELGELFV